MVLETNIHANHLTASQYLKEKLGRKIAISNKTAFVQETFGLIYNLDLKYLNVYQLFDHLFEDGEQFKIGEFAACSILTSGHTSACLS